MPGTIPPSRLRLIRRIARLADSASALRFSEAYYRGVDEADLAAAPVAARAGLAAQHLRIGSHRRPGEILLRVWNPPVDDRKEGSPHTRVLLVVDDMPFLVDTLSIVLRDFWATHLLVHPVLHARRNGRGRLQAIEAGPARNTRAESWQLHEIDRETDPARLQRLETRLRQAIEDLTRAVADWQPMRERARQLAETLAGTADSVSSAAREAGELLRWMADDHFTFLGYRYYRLERGRREDALLADRASGLGILRGEGSGRRLVLAGAQRDLARSAEPLFVTKANRRSTVHRATYLDYVGVKDFDARGHVLGEYRFLGLWTSGLYRQPTGAIPLLRLKAARVVAALGADGDSHDSKAVQHVLETYPRDELFQASEGELLESVRGIVNLYERRRVRVFPRRDPFGRFWSCLVYVPRDRYHTQAREQIEARILGAYGGTAVESEVQLGESTLARLHLRVRTPAATAAPPAAAELEQQIAELLRTWTDRLRAALLKVHPESAVLAIVRRYGEAFPLAYHEDTRAATAVDDIAALEELSGTPGHWHWRAYRQGTDTTATLRLKLFRQHRPVPVADILPLFESLGLKLVSERPYGLRGLAVPTGIQDFELQRRSGETIDLAADAPRVLAALTAMLEERAETDGFNRLVLAAG
ncbi:MAG: NAD-glutamate dehydrogenase, partial [Gammaproteobacteria bacterium]